MRECYGINRCQRCITYVLTRLVVLAVIYHSFSQYNLSKWRRSKSVQTQDAVQEAEETDYVTADEVNVDKGFDRAEDRKDAEEVSPPENTTSLNDELLVKSNASFEDDSTIPWRTAHMMWYSGLRGAVSYGLVRTFPDTQDKNTIVVTTMLLVLLTTFLLGGTTEMVLNFLHIPTGIDENQYLQSLETRKLLPGFLLNFEMNKLYAWVVREDDEVVKNKKKEDDEDDPELTPYESIEVVNDPHTQSIVLTNRKRMIFDYGA
jgi:hypothetical protein